MTEYGAQSPRTSFKIPTPPAPPLTPQVPILLYDAVCVNFVCTWVVLWFPVPQTHSFLRSPEYHLSFIHPRVVTLSSFTAAPCFPSQHTQSPNQSPTPVVKRATHNGVTQTVILKPPCLKRRNYSHRSFLINATGATNYNTGGCPSMKANNWNFRSECHVVISHHPRSKDFNTDHYRYYYKQHPHAHNANPHSR
jgi:hypothetical protein